MGTHRPTTPPKLLEIARGFISVGAQVASINCGKIVRKNCDASDVPGVESANLPAVDMTFHPAARSPVPAAALPAEPLAHVFTAFRSFFQFCAALLGATTFPMSRKSSRVR